MTADTLRKKFLDFFLSKGHRIVASDSLVPKDDPTVLFTPAGMNQFKKEFLGFDSGFRRAATAQRCLRTDDLDKVGKTPAHHTFFEMLGNFSFGDYFKKEAITWAWEFLTKELKLRGKDLWVSVYKDDIEAFDIWKDQIRVPEDKIIKLGDKENFWPSEAKEKGPNGPCGSCSEIFFDYGKDIGCGRPDCSPGCDCGRFVEAWNLVFTQFNRRDGGILEPLPNKNIDTGMGLERLASVMQGVSNNFQTDLFLPILKEITRFAKIQNNQYIYAVSDHIRAVVFAINDGVLPSNEERGYVVRKLIRRSVLNLQAIGIKKSFLYSLVASVSQAMKEPYPELEKSRENIAQIILAEENNFHSILDKAPQLCSQMFQSLKDKAEGTGTTTFKLYDTYGIPLEQIEATATKMGFKINMDEFNKCLNEQKELSKHASTMKTTVFHNEGFKIDTPQTEFLGYSICETESKVLKIFKDKQEVNVVKEANTVEIVLDKSPFYPESGGQIGDTGFIAKDNSIKVQVYDTQKIDDIIIHFSRIIKGELKVADLVSASVDKAKRLSISRNHTATHLLQAALRKVLGTHIQQQGSLVADDKLRFDFTHFKKIEKSQLDRIEELVNEYIRNNDNLIIKQMSLKEARDLGALAFFGEKYADEVRVVSIGDYSKELCGGAHLNSTGQIGLFKIVSESSIAQGIRRIEAVTGTTAYKKIKQAEDIILEATNILKSPPEKIIEQITKTFKYSKELEKKLNALRLDLFRGSINEIINKAREIEGIKVIIQNITDADMEFLRSLTDLLKQKLNSAVIALGSVYDGKINLVMALTADLIKNKLDASKMIKKIAQVVGGSGGGRPELAQAGGNDINKLDKALGMVVEIVKETLE